MGGGAVLVAFSLGILPFVLSRPLDLQTTYYAISTFAGALVLAALVELRLDGLERKLNDLLDLVRKKET